MNKTKIEWADYRKGDHRILTPEGYILVYCPRHPSAKSKGHLYEHRYLMEKHLGRFLSTEEHIHHRDGNKANNLLANLELITSSEHAKRHDQEQPEKTKYGTTALNNFAKQRKKPRNKVQCACGCGTILITPDGKGRNRTYFQGHNQRGKGWRWHAKKQD